MKKYALRIDGNITIIEANSDVEAYKTAVAFLTCGLEVAEATQEEIDWYEGFTGGSK